MKNFHLPCLLLGI